MADKFQKRPVVIEAMQYTGGPHNGSDIVLWVVSHDGQAEWHSAEDAWEGEVLKCEAIPEVLIVSTLEGDLYASIGDWIIKGVEDEFYPCKPSVFGSTYDRVPDGQDEKVSQ